METEVIRIEKKDVEALSVSQYTEPTTIDGFIQAGKAIVKTTQCYQALLAHYAIQVCKIRHGGRSNGIYTIKDYANDIGIKHKTLQNWSLIYRRVIQHLGIPPEKLTAKDWQVANKIAYLQEQENRTDNVEKGTNRKRNDYKEEKSSKRTPEQVKKAFNDNFVMTFESEVYNWNNTVMTMKNKIEKRDLKLANDKILTEFMNNLDSISDHINDYLTQNKKRSQQ
jgi:hypothetical protein